jgi:alpha-galactosidase
MRARTAPLCAALLLAAALPAAAVPPASPRPAVRFLSDSKLFVLETTRTSYVLGVNEQNEVQLVHWGGRLARDADLEPARTREGYSFESRAGLSEIEYPGWGGLRFAEPCLKATFADGVRDVVLKYASHEIRDNTLVLHLKDITYDLGVELVYRVFPAHDIVAKHATIRNGTSSPVVLESAASGVFHMPFHLPNDRIFRLTHLAGRWASETLVVREAIEPGKKVLESRRGTTSHQANPFFAIDEDGRADEEHGRVWFGALGWSGSWKLTVERTPEGLVRVTGGFNDFDFAYRLAPGATLETPPFYGGFTSEGFGEASRLLHRLQIEEILPDRAARRVRPVLYNSWEATLFAVDEAGQKALAAKAARLGVERFVMDDGWFGARNDDRAGLGDWSVNPKKFPNGLEPLIDHVKSLGMDFGLWVEPEMVNPDSDLYRKHPDWALHFPGRPRSESRNQLVLNFARPDVQEHVFGVLDRLLAENDIRFFKWDMNRHFAEPGWPAVAPEEQKKVWVEYVRGVYSVMDRLRARHPGVEIESCSGGGGRVDLGMLQRVDEVWTSDNTEALDRLRIQEGFTMAYTPKVMMAWVTDVPNMNGRVTPLRFRFLTAMQGSLGIGGNLDHWSEADGTLATEMVAWYKRARPSVQEGDLHRLLSPSTDGAAVNEYVGRGGRQVVVFACRQSQQYLRALPTVRLRGLVPDAVYRVERLDDKLVDKAATLSGAALMERGLTFDLRGDFDATSVLLERVE